MTLTPQDIQAITEAITSTPHKCPYHDTVEDTLKSVSAAQTELTLAQAVLARDMAAQAEAVKDLPKVHASVVEVKTMLTNSLAQFDKTEHAHEEIFTRLRQSEEKQAVAESFCKSGGERLKKLEASHGDCQAVRDAKGDIRKVIWTGVIGIGLAIVWFLAKAGLK